MNDLSKLIDNISDNVSDDTREKITSMAAKVYDCSVDELTSEQLTDIIRLDLGITISKFSISASSTRRTEVQYCTNNYIAAMEFDCSGLSDNIMNIIDNTEEGKRIDRYVQLKATAYKLIATKYEGNEAFLRELLRTAETKDGVVAVGRFA